MAMPNGAVIIENFDTLRKLVAHPNGSLSADSEPNKWRDGFGAIDAGQEGLARTTARVQAKRGGVKYSSWRRKTSSTVF